MLIVEDGSIVANANSYVDDNEAQLIADNLGLSLPTDINEREKVLKQGTWYLEDKCYKGQRVSYVQVLSFPRSGVHLNGFKLALDAIPQEIKNAQVAAASGYSEGAITATVNDGKNIQKEKIDVLEVTYFDNGKTDSGVKITFADQWASRLTCGKGGRFLNVVRC